MSDAVRETHERWMIHAIKLAEKAFESNEIPVGAIVVKNNKIIGKGYNQREQLNDPTAHAEILAITAAANSIGDWRLKDCTLYVTKEPCSMCAGAVVNSRIEQVIFGCYDDDCGYCGSKIDLCNFESINKKIVIKGGINEEICLGLIQEFFKNKRKK